MDPRFPACYKPDSKPHKFCPGCGHPLVLKMLGEVVDEMGIANKTIFLVDIGCSLLAWDYFNLPTSQTHHGRTIPVAAGFKMADPEKIVIAYMGDGGGYAIGLQHTLHSCLRNDPITTILVNNTCYAMTGGQMAPTTIENENTTTTPTGRDPKTTGRAIMGPELLSTIVTNDAYVARGSVSKQLILKGYIRKAIETQINKKAYSFVEALSYCPLNWKTDARETIAFLRETEKVYPQKEFTTAAQIEGVTQ
ncbi:2-oxoglutarate synthase [Candidatus Microgenomates bacterium]|nr:2-oxoglutarate synthase [Candidatus Microgenomates bacterium]